ADRIDTIARAAVEVAPPIFFSLLIITVSFLPVLALGGEEGKLFAPLAYAKTYAMAVAAALSVTLVPALLAILIKGRIAPEQANPLNRLLHALYRPVLRTVLTRPRTVLLVALVVALSAAWPLSRLGSEFMPELDEGDLLYMPMTLPSISIAKAREVLQQTNRIIATVPEVARVFGKAGRAETATDPAPLEMIETTIQLKPRAEWRPGLTPQALREELERKLRIPGLSNTWTQPIRNRIDMQATGARTPVALRVTGPDAGRAEALAVEIEKVLRPIPGVASASAERQGRGRTIEIEIDRAAAARLELSVADVQQVIDAALGGMAVTDVLEGRERYGVSLRFPPEYRDGVASLRSLPVVSHNGAVVALEKIARIRVVDGPAMLRSENARPAAWVYVDVAGASPAALVAEAEKAVAAAVSLPSGYALEWSGRYRQWDEAQERLQQIVPAVLVAIVMLIYLAFRRAAHVWMLLLSLPLALAGSAWFLYWLDYRLSVAVWVGLIALAGVAVETAILMLIYLEQAYSARLHAARAAGRPLALHDIREAVEEGALQRLRPKIMTVTVIIAGLLPIMLRDGTGGDVMRHVAAPMLGGIVSAAALTLLVVPALYYLWRVRELAAASNEH
ncbi:MAG: efflux RND transporter permease subunit, partial [Telluria sp.]